MRPYLRPSLLFWGLLAIGLAILFNQMPLLETLGYEYAMVSALFCALGAGHLGAIYPHQLSVERVSLVRHFFRAVRRVVYLPAIFLVISLLNGIRVPYCNVWEGLAFFVLMPLFGTAIAATLGFVVGVAAAGKLKATLLYLVLFICALASGFYSFYATPGVFLFHPFVGYYPGVLYDRLIAIDSRLLIYRLITILHMATVISVANTFFHPKHQRFSPERFVFHAKKTYLALGLLFLSCAFELLSPYLGHRTDRARLTAALPNHVATRHLDIYFPKETKETLKDELVADARFSLHQVSEYLGAPPSQRIAVFFFLDAAHKGRLIGAKETNVAKPWRREVYVVLNTPPHAILRHELAHAVSADFGTGPFRIAGGLLPNPALIEGLATAAGGMRGDLSVHQWAAAMAALDMMPPLEKLFGLGFFDVPAGAAYTAAGSLSDYVRQQYGPKALREAYRLADFEQATGISVFELETAWRRFLDTIPLKDADKAVAEHRFDRTPVIRTTCVHEVARITNEGDYYSGLEAYDAANACYNTAHRKSGQATFTYRNLFFAAIRAGARQEMRRMADHVIRADAFTKADKALATEILADLDRISGKSRPYAQIYRELAAQAGRAKEARRLLVKAFVADFDRPLPSGFIHVFSPVPKATVGVLIRGALSIAKAAHDYPEEPILQYLLARQQFNGEDYEAAWDTLLGISDFDALPKPIAVAARMLRGRVLMALKRYSKAAQQFSILAQDGSLREGDRIIATDWQDRARFMNRMPPVGAAL